MFGRASIRTIGVGSRDDFEAMNSLIEAKKLNPVVDTVFLFEQSKKAYQALESQKFFGKIVIYHES
ncbi:zinc-binding dehydrogenase [Alteribacillus sp. JSM 102045]|uniref:zinc-binding dehydrogenase n=1 Tax=Alteribacillus sp. JSM 102045 TaxID=1562101 RepID=UPI0035C0DCC8